MFQRLRKIFNTGVRPSPERRAPVRVLLVDDSAFIRLVLSRRLSQHPRLDVIGDAGNPGEALQRVAELRPDVIVLDMEMPRGTGLDLLQALSPEDRRRCILFTSIHPEHSSLQRSLELGVAGYMRKSTLELDLNTLVQELASRILSTADRFGVKRR